MINTPKRVKACDTVSTMAMSGHSTFKVQGDSLYSYGLDQKGHLGIGSLESQESAFRVSVEGDVQGVAVGETHSLLWTQQGRLFSWGDASHGKLAQEHCQTTYNYIRHYPSPVYALGDRRVV